MKKNHYPSMTKQPPGRVSSISTIIGISESCSAGGFRQAEPIEISQRDDLEIVSYADYFAEIAGSQTTVTAKGKKVAIVDLVAKLRELKVDETWRISAGRHRAFGAAIAGVLPAMIVTDENAHEVALAENAAKGLVTKISADGICIQVYDLYQRGLIKRECDIERQNLSRFMAQRAHRFCLVREKGISEKAALQLGKEPLKKLLDKFETLNDAELAIEIETVNNDGAKTVDKDKTLSRKKIEAEVEKKGANNQAAIAACQAILANDSDALRLALIRE